MLQASKNKLRAKPTLFDKDSDRADGMRGYGSLRRESNTSFGAGLIGLGDTRPPFRDVGLINAHRDAQDRSYPRAFSAPLSTTEDSLSTNDLPRLRPQYPCKVDNGDERAGSFRERNAPNIDE
jgi:hypothetical protein